MKSYKRQRDSQKCRNGFESLRPNPLPVRVPALEVEGVPEVFVRSLGRGAWWLWGGLVGRDGLVAEMAAGKFAWVDG